MLLCSRSKMGYFSLDIYNECLHKVKSIEYLTPITNEVTCICANESFIYYAYYTKTSDGNGDEMSFIGVLDWSLNVIDNCVNKQEPIHNRIDQIQTSNGCLYLKHNRLNRIIVLNEKMAISKTFDGIVKGDFVINNDFLVVYDEKNKQICYYNIVNGDCVFKNDLIGFPDGLSIIFNELNVVFYDSNEFKLYQCDTKDKINIPSLYWYSSIYYK
jgi:hypothetical protein